MSGLSPASDRRDALTIVVPVRDPEEADVASWGRAARVAPVREVLIVHPRTAPGVPRPTAGVRMLSAPLGRAAQMNAGAAAARTDYLLFLHADTRIEGAGITALADALGRHRDAVFAFSLAFRSNRLSFRVLEALAGLRDRVRPFPLGDQGLALARRAFLDAGGFPDEPLFEDVMLMRRLRRAHTVRVLPEAATTGAERFERIGVWRNVARNAGLIALHGVGVSARTLVRYYYGAEYLERWRAAHPSRPQRPQRAEPVSE